MNTTLKTKSDPLHIGVLAHEFLINMGANDLLKNLLRGLNEREDLKVFFLVPDAQESIILSVPQSVKNKLRRFKVISKILKHLSRKLVFLKLSKKTLGHPYTFYQSAFPTMTIVQCQATSRDLNKIIDLYELDIIFPSIHKLNIKVPYVTYWPDCQPKHYPQFFDDASQSLRDRMIYDLLESGMPMLVNSHDAKNDIVRFYNANPEQIFNLPFAPIIDPSVFEARPELLHEFDLPKTYFLVSNQFWIHKSIETVIEAVGICNKNGFEFDVVFTGKMEEPRKPEYIENLHKLIEDLNLETQIHLLGYVDKLVQLEIMKNCIAVIQPTLFEGGPGGGSVYDALGLGSPVILSDIPVNLEIPNDFSNVTYFKAGDSEELAKKMIQFGTPAFEPPQHESLWRISLNSRRTLAVRLMETIDQALRRNHDEI